jgi:hypothetical protein
MNAETLEEFRKLCAGVAEGFLNNRKVSGWHLEYVSFYDSEGQQVGGMEGSGGSTVTSAHLSVMSRGKVGGDNVRFSATCRSGVCSVDSISFGERAKGLI